MDAKKTLMVGGGALVLGLLLAWLIPGVARALGIVFLGTLELVLLLAGVLFIMMGWFQVREDKATIEKERAEADRAATMSAAP